MPRRSSVEKPTEDPNVEKRVTRGSVRKSEGGPSIASTPEKQKDNKSKNQSPAKASSASGKRGRPAKRNVAADDEDSDKAEHVESVENQTTAVSQDGVKDANDHDTKSTDASKESEDASNAEQGETASEEPNQPESNGKKRLADNNDDEGHSVKKPRSDEPVGECKEACAMETSTPAVSETAPIEIEKTEAKEGSATDKLAAGDAPVASAENETGDTTNHSNNGTGITSDVCSKVIPSESTAETKATTDEVIKENGCREAESGIASDAC